MTSRHVMLIWAGWSWSTHQIETETLLPDDVPKSLEVTHPSYRNDPPTRFVLAGRCAEYPLYKQVD